MTESPYTLVRVATGTYRALCWMTVDGLAALGVPPPYKHDRMVVYRLRLAVVAYRELAGE